MGCRCSLKSLLLGASVFLLWSCALVGEETPRFFPSRSDPRIFVNDAAANDLLNYAATHGFRLYAQPGAAYQLFVNGFDSPGYRLYLIRLIGSSELEYPEYASSRRSGDTLSFSFESLSGDEEEQVWGVMYDPKGQKISRPADDIWLKGKGVYDEKSFGVNYHLRGGFSAYPPDSLPGLVKDIHDSLNALFAKFGGIKVASGGYFQSGGSDQVSVKFPGGLESSVSLPESNSSYVNVVFVENIEAETGGHQVLGMAPREARRMHSNSRELVYIALKGPRTTLAGTLAHELGHFFGLRHTVSTPDDLKTDGDNSNLEDGFSDTEFCQISGPSALMSTLRNGPYCLRVLWPSNQAALCGIAAMKNLMFPMTDGRVEQDYMSPEQKELLQANIGLLPH